MFEIQDENDFPVLPENRISLSKQSRSPTRQSRFDPFQYPAQKQQEDPRQQPRVSVPAAWNFQELEREVYSTGVYRTPPTSPEHHSHTTHVNDAATAVLRMKFKKLGMDVSNATITDEELNGRMAFDYPEDTTVHLCLEQTEYQSVELAMKTGTRSSTGKHRFRLESRHDHSGMLCIYQSLQAQGKGFYGDLGVGEWVMNFQNEGRNQALYRSLLPGDVKDAVTSPSGITDPVRLPPLTGSFRWISFEPILRKSIRNRVLEQLVCPIQQVRLLQQFR